MIGIIANPSSGKDIRRLVAQGLVFSNLEKVNIIQRILVVLHDGGINDIWTMPDSYGIVQRAIEGMKRHLKIEIEVKELDFQCKWDQTDSTKAGELFKEKGASCIITLGGDGTNRAVAKGCEDVPLIPISTGTNNVFPEMIEGTVAGLVATVVEKDLDQKYLKLKQCKKLNIYKNGELKDIALIDAAVTADLFIGARAIWGVENIRELFVTVSRPDCIGMSAIAGSIHPLSENENKGLYAVIGKKGTIRISAAIAPGLMLPISIERYQEIRSGERIKIKTEQGIIALDGEREVDFYAEDSIEVEFSDAGPWVIDVEKTLHAAANDGFFVF